MNTDLNNKLRDILDLSKKTGLKPNVFLEQVVFLIYLKLIDEGGFTETLYHDQVSEGEIFYDQAERFKWKNWINKPEGEVKGFLKNEVFPFISSVENKGEILAEVFNNSTFQIESETIVLELLKIIDSINFLELQYDDRIYLIDELTENLLYNRGSRLGVFPTPRLISKFIVELIQPQGNESIFDPGCGSGTLLTEFHDYNRINHMPEYGNAQYHGIDISRSMIRLSILNFILRGAYNFDFYRADFIREQGGIRDKSLEKEYDVIVADPPLGFVIPKDEVRESLNVNFRKIEALFLNAILQNLSEIGIAAIILPDSFLFSKVLDYRSLRVSMLEKNQLLGVISLPNSAFIHHGVNLNLIMVNKEPIRKNGKVWFCDLSKRNITDKNSFNDVTDLWKEFKASNYSNPPGPKANSVFESSNEIDYWWADKEQIKKNEFDLTLNLYKPIIETDQDYKSSHDLIDQIQQLNEKIEYRIEELFDRIKNRSSQDDG